MTTPAAMPVPARPTRAAGPATAALTAGDDSGGAAAAAHQSPLSTPSRLPAVPGRRDARRCGGPTSAPTARPAQARQGHRRADDRAGG
ncbi:hypothetical protein [Streptomyces sp. NPDC054834]